MDQFIQSDAFSTALNPGRQFFMQGKGKKLECITSFSSNTSDSISIFQGHITEILRNRKCSDILPTSSQEDGWIIPFSSIEDRASVGRVQNWRNSFVRHINYWTGYFLMSILCTPYFSYFSFSLRIPQSEIATRKCSISYSIRFMISWYCLPSIAFPLFYENLYKGPEHFFSSP